MSSLPRFLFTIEGTARVGRLSTLGVIALLASACSADIARFDLPAVALSEPTSTAALPTPPENVGSRYNLGGDGAGGFSKSPEPQTYNAPSSAPSDDPTPRDRGLDRGVDVTALPEPVPSQPVVRPAPSYAPAPRPQPATSFAPAPVDPDERGEEIEVQRGDTLYGLSRRHGVSLNELMRVNGLTSPALKPGQKLALPSGRVKPRAPRPAETATITPEPAPSDWSGTYTIQRGDSLYGIARRFNVKSADLQRYNGISDVRRVMPGTVLKVPGAPTTLAEAATSEGVVDTPAGAPQSGLTVTPPVTSQRSAEPQPSTAPAQPTILNAPRPMNETKVAELNAGTASDVASPTTPAPPASGSIAEGGKLRWPVKGRIVAGFGPRSDGTHNDGINIAVPQGTDVHAAEDGTVAYAGDELRGYGNLILLRHDNGWVTAYAHADRLLVKRGDRVRRGQVIAKAGKTGQVDQPQLHFEVRQGQKPVDPTPYLESR